jgi:hypothetical protein
MSALHQDNLVDTGHPKRSLYFLAIVKYKSIGANLPVEVSLAPWLGIPNGIEIL